MNYNIYVEKFNENNNFMKHNGMRIVKLKKGYAEVEMDITENTLNIQGSLHGGAIFTLADVAAGAASKSHGFVSVTLNGNINFIKKVTKGRVKAIATKLHMGSSTGVYRVEVIDDSDCVISNCTFTMFLTGDVIK